MLLKNFCLPPLIHSFVGAVHWLPWQVVGQHLRSSAQFESELHSVKPSAIMGHATIPVASAGHSPRFFCARQLVPPQLLLQQELFWPQSDDMEHDSCLSLSEHLVVLLVTSGHRALGAIHAAPWHPMGQHIPPLAHVVLELQAGVRIS